MKKISILLMLAFVFSFGAFASNVVTKEKKNQIEKNEKRFLELCFSINPISVECPDGSSFFGGVDVFFNDCATGAVIGVVCIFSDWGDDPCGEGNDYGF